jgi:ADP-ribose pyrophosphatase YjhB (NUDIX family)
MLQKIVGKIWRKLPRIIRVNLVRATQASFTISVGVVIADDNNRILLLDHVLRPASGWGIPGGFIDSGEQPEFAARREIREETGLELENLRLIWIKTMARHVEIIFFATAKNNGIEAQAKSREIFKVAWFNADMFPAEMSNYQKNQISEVLKVVNSSSL